MKMKKCISLILCVIMLTYFYVMPSFAQDKISNQTSPLNTYEFLEQGTVIYLDDGSYFKTKIISEPTAYSSSVTKTKSVDYHNASGKLIFSLYVTGTFSINYGTSVTCTSKSHRYQINNSAWSCTSASSHISNNDSTASAVANGTFIRKILGIKVDTINAMATLTCDKNGNFS